MSGRTVTSVSLIAIEIGGTKLQLSVGAPAGKIIDRRRLQVVATAGAAGIRKQIESALPELLERWHPRAAAIGFGGPVQRSNGRVARSHQIEGWSDFPLQQWFTEVSGLPSLVENDANIAALGEARCGAGKEANPVFYVTLGSGVGGGLVVDGQIYHGASPGEAEIGHVRLDRNGTTVEGRCSGWAMDQRIRQLCANEPESFLAQLTRTTPGGEARHLKAAWDANDPLAHRLITELCSDLAYGLSHVVHLMHPAAIILGGGLSLVGEPLRAGLAAILPSQLMEVFRPGPVIHLAALGEDAVPVGCLMAAHSLL